MKWYLIGLSIFLSGKAGAKEISTYHFCTNDHQFEFVKSKYLPDSNGKGTTYPIISVDVPLGFYRFTQPKAVSIATPVSSFSFGLGISFLFGQRYTGRWQTALGYQNFSPKAKSNSNSSFETAKLHYLRIPLQYQFYLNNNMNLFAGAGAYGSVLLANSADGIFIRTKPEKIDAGFISSLGLWLVPRLLVQVQAQWGMINVDEAIPQFIKRNQSYSIIISFGVSNNLKKIKTKNGITFMPGNIKSSKKSEAKGASKKASPIFKKVLPI